MKIRNISLGVHNVNKKGVDGAHEDKASTEHNIKSTSAPIFTNEYNFHLDPTPPSTKPPPYLHLI